MKGFVTEGILRDKGGMMEKVRVGERIEGSGEKRGKRMGGDSERKNRKGEKEREGGKKCPRFPCHLTGSKTELSL